MTKEKVKDIVQMEIILQKKLETIAQIALDKKLIDSWYFNGHSFVIKFKRSI